MKRRGIQVATGVALGTGVTAIVLLLGLPGGDEWSADPNALPGSYAPSPIRLTDLSGDRTTLPDDLDRPAVVFFGYTNCPDVCPPTLSKLAAASDSLRSVGEEPPTVVFVTVDPIRDAPATMREYLNRFDPSFEGLTGEPQEVADAAEAWGVYAAPAGAQDIGEHHDPSSPGTRAPRGDSVPQGVRGEGVEEIPRPPVGGYVVDHTARSFVLGRAGEVVATFGVDTPVAAMVRTLRLLAATGR